MRRLYEFSVALLVSALLVLAACTAAPSASVTGTFGPVTFVINSAGKITVAVGPRFVTPLGVFSVQAGVTVGLDEELCDDALLVLIRQTVNGQLRDTVYRVNSGQELNVDFEGHWQLNFQQDQVLIEPVPGQENIVRILPTTRPSVGPTTTPVPVYRPVFTDRTVELPDPIGLSGLSADLDVPKSGTGIDSSDYELRWEYGTGLSGGFGNVQFGHASGDAPTPESCTADANARAAGTIPPEDLSVSQTFCIITSMNNLAIARIVDIDGDEPDRATLVLHVSLWTSQS